MQPYYANPTATLHHGDCLALLPHLPDSSVDAVLTDAPYSSGGLYRSDRTATDLHSKYFGDSLTAPSVAAFSGDNRDQRGYLYWSALWLLQAYRITRPGGACMLWTDWRQLPTTTDALQAGGWIYRGIIPWVKPDPRPQMGRFASACEYVVWGSKGAMPPAKETGCLPGVHHARAPRGADKHHLTEKPLSVLRALIRITQPGGVVLDPFTGSGGIGVAAALEGRRFVGVEITEHYAAVAAARLRAAATHTSPSEQGDLLDGLPPRRADR